MSPAPKYDGRRANELEAELLRRAEAVLSGDGAETEIGIVARAIIKIAARVEEEVTKRLDEAPAKQADNFYTAAGIGRDPARPASLPVAFKLVDGAAALTAPAATQLIASLAEPVVFETDAGIDLVPGKVSALRGLDADKDAISKASDAVVDADLPRRAVVTRRLLGGAAAGATKVQIDPPAELKAGMLLNIGDGDDVCEYLASAIQGDLVTIDPPLETAVERDTPVREVTEFAPFAETTRNYQAHALYLGHSTLLDLPSKATILVSGVALPPETEWNWWGKLTDNDDPAWQEFPSDDELAKPAGKLVKRKINGQESLWLRATLPDKKKSTGHIPAQDVRLAIGGTLCGTIRETRCPMTAASIAFAAIANTIPIVPNEAFQPFGREPRLYDSFYLGSDEAFAKAGAEITLCFDLAGADLGPLVAQVQSETIFGVGTDGLLYFLELNPSGPKVASPTLLSLPPPTNDQGIVRLKERSPIAMEVGVRRIAVIAADEQSIYLSIPQNLDGSPKPNWDLRLLPAPGNVTALAFGRDDTALFALTEAGTLYQWNLSSTLGPTHREHVLHLLPVQNGGTVLLVVGDEKQGTITLLVDEPDGSGPSVPVNRRDLPKKALSVFEDAGRKTYYIAGYDELAGQQGYGLRLVVAARDEDNSFVLPLEQYEIGEFAEALPVVFSSGPEIDESNFQLPLLTIATPRPTHVSWEEDSGAIKPKVEPEDVPIGPSTNPERQICRSSRYEVVQASGVGILFRPIRASAPRRAQWDLAGPKRASNPALSWEYWNGESWWSLAARPNDLADKTSNFTVSGGVIFTVPKDIAPTEVVGKKSYWVRARLIGGDYGEAEVVEVRTGVFTRDTSTIRAPTVVQLKLGYCALEPTLPEAVLTEDNLGFIDQTSANTAGLEFPVFTPVAELMNPVTVAEASATPAAEAISCDDPCPHRAEDAPDPCEAPGEYESCDSPCIPPPNWRSHSSRDEVEGFVRGIMIGFDQPFSGETITLYIDAEPTATPTELVAEILQGGRFVRAEVVSDLSCGLTESGCLTLGFPKVPDESELLGVSAHWLRLHPKTNSGLWAPVIRGVHLNAVMTHSIETHAMERLGASLAVEGQEFRLAGTPVLFDDPKQIKIVVKEAVGEDEKTDEKLDIVRISFEPDQDWVCWKAVDVLAEESKPTRIFEFDADQGVVKFGDGHSALIPPLGADIVAVQYKRIFGVNANGIPPGTQIPPLSPLAGVDRVYALNYSAGGSDVETLESARRRAAAKLRHDRRILIAADLEEHVRTLSPRIAQVRLETRGGRSRLIIALAGADAQPSSADLREWASAIRQVAGFGLARKGALEVVAPRLLPLAIELRLQPARPGDFAEATEQAKEAIKALFDPATGNHDGSGWPIGRLPDEQDLAAALTRVEPLALLTNARIERADRDVTSERALPATIPADVLVRVDLANMDVQRAQEMAT